MKRHGLKRPTAKDLEGRRAHRLAIGVPAEVNRTFDLSAPHRQYYNQGGTTECVAFSSSELMTVLNGSTYDPGWLFWRAQEIDGVPGESGTTTDAALRILRDNGHVTHVLTGTAPTADDPTAVPVRAEGISEFRWFPGDPDEALAQGRACIASGMPFLFAMNWYGNFGGNKRNGREYVDPLGEWPYVPSLHQLLIDGAMDDGGYFTTPNSWGWPASQCISYEGFKRLFVEGAWAAAVTDFGASPSPDPTPTPTFECRFCHKHFPNKRKLKRHIQRRHKR